MTALLMAAAIPGHAKAKKDKGVPAILGTSRYVYVEAFDGDQFDPRITPEDREAIADVQNALRAWDRYSLTAERKDAEIVVRVRKGRLATARGTLGSGGIGMQDPMGSGPSQGSGPGTRPAPGGGVMVGAGGEVGPSDDLLEVDAVNPEGGTGALLWRRELHDGLDGPTALLVRELRTAVDRAYPPEAPKKQSNP